MKTMVKLVMLLAVLAICMPAQGEVLIYSTLWNCWAVWGNIDLVLGWSPIKYTQRGFLILDVEFNNGGFITGMNSAYQVEYERNGQDKEYEGSLEDYTIEVFGNRDIWVIDQVYARDTNAAEIIIVMGKTRNMNIGLGKGAKRKVARVLTGNIQVLNDDTDLYLLKQMCTMSLRLHNNFTRLANDPDIGNQDFEFAISDIVEAWLERRGYERVI